MSPADDIPPGRKIPLTVTLDDIARPRHELPDHVYFQLQPGERVISAALVRKIAGGHVTLGNGNTFSIGPGTVTLT